MRRVRRGAGPFELPLMRRWPRRGMTTGAEGGRPKRSSNTVWSSVFGQVEPGSAPAGIRQAVNPARAERRRRLRLWSGSVRVRRFPPGDRLDHCRVPTRRRTDCPDATSIRVPRARPFAQRSARPLSKGSAKRRPASPGAGVNTGRLGAPYARHAVVRRQCR